MPEGSFNLVYTTGVERESGVQAPHRRGSLKLSIETPTWSYQVRNTTAHGRGGDLPPSSARFDWRRVAHLYSSNLSRTSTTLNGLEREDG